MPFPGVSQGLPLYERIVNEPAPSVRLFRPDLPPGWVRIIETALAKRPCDRYVDLNRMVSALEDQLMPLTPIRLGHAARWIPSLASRDLWPGIPSQGCKSIPRKERLAASRRRKCTSRRKGNQKSAPSAESSGGSEGRLQEGCYGLPRVTTPA